MPKNKIKPIKLKLVMLAIAIAVVLSGFVILFVQSVYPSPKYQNFCNEIRPTTLDKIENITQEKCEQNKGEWTSQGYCDYHSKCQEEYNRARDKYKLTAFTISIISGLIALSVGIILQHQGVSMGLMLGGTFLILFGTATYWSNLTNWLRTLLLGIVLIILIWLGYKKLNF